MDGVIECERFERLELEDLFCHVEKEREGMERHYIGKFDRGNEKTLTSTAGIVGDVFYITAWWTDS